MTEPRHAWAVLPFVRGDQPRGRFAYHDYQEQWELRAACHCGQVWHVVSGKRKMTARFGPVYADLAHHVRLQHCVMVRTVKIQNYNVQLIASTLADSILAALHIA